MQKNVIIISLLLVMATSAGIVAAFDIDDISAFYGFEEMEMVKLNHQIKNLIVADINGDKRNDIIVVNNRKARIEILLQKKSISPAEKQVAVDPKDIDINALNPDSRFHKDSLYVSQRVTSLACGDLNSDGMMDLAFYGDPRGLYVMLQKAGDSDDTGEGDGEQDLKTLRWRTRKKIRLDDGLLSYNALACGDLNNDGACDLALAGRKATYIIIQKEDGSLAEPVKYPTAALTHITEIADLNGDNINDLVLVTNDTEKPVYVRFGLETGQLGPESKFLIEKPWAVDIANIDADAGDEILCVDAASGRLICYKFTEQTDKDADWPILFYPLEAGDDDTKRDLVVGDFDGDGLDDIVVSEPATAELIFYRQIKNIGLAQPVRFGAFADIKTLSAANIDNDKKAEIGVLSVKEKAIGISKFENDRLTFPRFVDVIDQPVAMTLADIDSDKKTDCIYVSNDSNDVRSLRVIYNLAKKTTETTLLLELKDLNANPDDLKVLDVDQDGLNDVLIFVKYEQPVLIRQTKKKNFELVDAPDAHASLIKDASLSSIAVADVDRKKGKELLIAQKNFARSLIFENAKSWKVIDQYNAKGPENNISAVAAFQINAVGSQAAPAILLLDGHNGQLQILKADSDKTYRLESQLDVGEWNAVEHLKIHFAPLTGSKTKNILLFDSRKFALITPPDNGKQPLHLEKEFVYETKIKDGVYGNLITGDINSDDRPDIIMVEYKQNHIEILTLDSEMKPAPAMRFKLFEQKGYRNEKGIKSSVEPRELKIADVTNDGKADLVTVIHDRIIVYPQD